MASRPFVEITNISPLIDKPALRELFECFGPLKRFDICPGKNSQIWACIAEFSSDKASEAAASISGTRLGDQNIQVIQKDFLEIKDKLYAALSTTRSQIEEARRKVAEWASPHAPAAVKKASTPKSDVDLRKEDQIKRTIYVGNIARQVREEHIRKFFRSQGNIKYLKMSGPAMDNPYCFIEFKDLESASSAHSLNGTMLGDRPVRIGHVKSPIKGIRTDILNNPRKLSQAVTNAKFALELVLEKKKKKVLKVSPKPFVDIEKDRYKRRRRNWSESRSPSFRRSRSRSRSSRRGRRNRSRSSSSYSSRSRSRTRRHKRRTEKRSFRSYSRSSGRSRRPSTWSNSYANKKNMIWDGFNWYPRVDVEEDCKNERASFKAGITSACPPGL